MLNTCLCTAALKSAGMVRLLGSIGQASETGDFPENSLQGSIFGILCKQCKPGSNLLSELSALLAAWHVTEVWLPGIAGHHQRLHATQAHSRLNFSHSVASSAANEHMPLFCCTAYSMSVASCCFCCFPGQQHVPCSRDPGTDRQIMFDNNKKEESCKLWPTRLITHASCCNDTDIMIDVSAGLVEVQGSGLPCIEAPAGGLWAAIHSSGTYAARQCLFADGRRQAALKQR